MSDLRSTPLRPETAHFAHDLFERIVLEQVEPWALFNVRGVHVQDFYGKQISLGGMEFSGTARGVFWNGYIDPFLRDATIRTLDWVERRITGSGLPGDSVFNETLSILTPAVFRVYKRMSTIDRRLAHQRERVPPSLERLAKPIISFIDQAVRARIQKHQHSQSVGKEKTQARREASHGEDPIRERIEAVLDRASDHKRNHPELSNAATANRLTERGTRQKFEGYSYEAVRKILQGTYRAAKERGLPDLKRWMEKKYH